MAYLGIDQATRAHLLGSLYDLSVTTSVEVTFFEGSFPFRKLNAFSAASLLWGTEQTLMSDDAKLTGGSEAYQPFRITDARMIQDLASSHSAASSQSLPQELEIQQETKTNPIVQNNMEQSDKSEPVPESQPLRKSTRKIVTPARFREDEKNELQLLMTDMMMPYEHVFILSMLTEASLQTVTPRNAHEALRSPQRAQWMAAMNREKACHLKNQTFGAVAKIVAPIKAVPADWVFRIKHRGGPVELADLQPKQFKARVVIRGQFMQEGINFNDTFAPVAKSTTLRFILAYATKYRCLLKSGDVETAFLTAKMDCETIVRMPPYWGPDLKDITGDISSVPDRILSKGVPGIPQGSRLFYETFATHLKSIGYNASQADKCLFFNSELKERNAVVLWVDDFIYMHQKESTFDKFMMDVRRKFTVPTAGPLKSFLGMEIIHLREEGKMYINQSNTVDVLLERAKMKDCNPVQTPLQPGTTFSREDANMEASAEDIKQYRSLVALANFLSCWTRPDITFAVNKLCKFMAFPGSVHWKSLKHLLRYLKGSRLSGLFYDFSGEGHSTLFGYTDASFADCPDSGKSTIAYAFFFGQAIISWYSKLNSFVATSTNYAEYCALANGAKEAEWLLLMFEQIAPDLKVKPITLFVDNSGVVSMVFNPVSHQANKHIRINCHYTRELANNKTIAPQRVTSEENISDIFTKSLPATTLRYLAGKIMAEPVQHNIMMMKQDPDLNSNDQFLKQWPYVAEVKKLLGADTYNLVETTDTFSTGRRKYVVTFFKDKAEIEKRLAMRLLSKDNRPYFVCKNKALESEIQVNRDPEPVPEPSYSPSAPDSPDCTHTPINAKLFSASPPQAFGQIRISRPVPSIVCLECSKYSDTEKSHLTCSSCNKSSFQWSCACVFAHWENEEKKDQEIRVKYRNPLARALVYHSIACPRVRDEDARLCTSANAHRYGLEKAACCKLY